MLDDFDQHRRPARRRDGPDIEYRLTPLLRDGEHAANRGGQAKISTAAAKAQAWVVPTNEELVVAAQTGALLGLPWQHAR